MLIGNNCGAHTVPYIEAKNASAHFEHEATTSKISDDKLFYCMQRGLSGEEAIALIVNGFVRDVLQQPPHGVHGRDAEADRHQLGGLCGLIKVCHAKPSKQSFVCRCFASANRQRRKKAPGSPPRRGIDGDRDATECARRSSVIRLDRSHRVWNDLTSKRCEASGPRLSPAIIRGARRRESEARSQAEVR